MAKATRSTPAPAPDRFLKAPSPLRALVQTVNRQLVEAENLCHLAQRAASAEKNDKEASAFSILIDLISGATAELLNGADDLESEAADAPPARARAETKAQSFAPAVERPDGRYRDMETPLTELESALLALRVARRAMNGQPAFHLAVPDQSVREELETNFRAVTFLSEQVEAQAQELFDAFWGERD